MIEYLEVRAKATREIIGIIDAAESVIWHTVYYGVGDFEIYAVANEKHIKLLKEGNWITRPDETPKEIGTIEHITFQNTVNDGTMIIASGRFAKSILDRRHIYKLSGKTNTPTILRGNVETSVRNLVKNNAISCSFDSARNIPFLKLGAIAGITKIIVDENGNAADKQVSFENLLEYSEGVLQEYQMAADVKIDDANDLVYTVYEGADRSSENTAGNEPVIFSQEYDNLLESTYTHENSLLKTAALIGGEGEGLERFYALIAGTATGIERREMWVDASSINKTYKEEGSDEEKTYTDAEYRTMLKTQGKQELANAIASETYEAKINVNGGVWRLNEDYFLGDIVTFQDNKLGKYARVRITELTEVQDENGYEVTPVFDFENLAINQILGTENYDPLATEDSRKLGVE